MEAKGYIKISRQVLSLDIWRDPYDCRLFFFCLLRASHNHYGTLKPGQLFYSVQSLAASLNWSRNSVAKHIRILADAGLIMVEHTAEGSVMTILRWSDFCGDTILGSEDFPAEPDAHPVCMNAQPLTKDAQPECMPCAPIEHYQNNTKKNQKHKHSARVISRSGGSGIPGMNGRARPGTRGWRCGKSRQKR